MRAYLDRNPEHQPFPKAHTQSQMFLKFKKKACAKFQRPEILAIQLRNLRNYAGERYYKSLPVRDAFEAMRFFRHKKVSTTQHYLLAMTTEYAEDDNWTTLITNTMEEEVKAVEKSWQFVTRNGDKALYRKREDL